jgi:DNA-binding CsgD family transcriptional regulator
MIKRKVDIVVSRQMQIVRWGNGVKLIEPELLGTPQTLNQSRVLGTVNNFMSLPLCCYFTNRQSQVQLLNDTTSELCGWESTREALGQSVQDIWPGEFSQTIIAHDKSVLEKNTPQILDEEIFDKHDAHVGIISFKFPWYIGEKEVAGIFGCSIISQPSITIALAALANTGLLTPQPSSLPLEIDADQKYFSRREREVLRLLVRAKTSKQIAGHLGLSHRTVEHYIENSKRKMGVSSKSELVDRVIDLF